MVKKFLAGFAAHWMLVSALVHAGTGGTMYYFMVKRQPPPIVADLDLTMVPMSMVMPNKGGGSGAKPVETWTLAKKGKKTPPPPPPEVVQTKEEVVKEEAQTPCEGDCAQGPVVGQGWGGGTGEGEGQYVPEEATSRKPRWIRNFIRPSDYPAIARQEGKDGRVVLVVLIGADGMVHDCRLLQGSYEALNEVALRKVKEAVFSPAYDHDNKPVSCKILMPIRFELR